MSCDAEDPPEPKSMSRAREWTAEVENLFRFQLAGYRDEVGVFTSQTRGFGKGLNLFVCDWCSYYYIT